MPISAREYFWPTYCRLLDQLAALNAALRTGKWTIFSDEDSGRVDITAERKEQVQRSLAELEMLFWADAATNARAS